MSGNLGFKMSEAIHSGADTTLAPTKVSARPPWCFNLLCRPLLVRAQGTDIEPRPQPRSQARPGLRDQTLHLNKAPTSPHGHLRGVALQARPPLIQAPGDSDASGALSQTEHSKLFSPSV